jgi:hypothetical protein
MGKRNPVTLVSAVVKRNSAVVTSSTRGSSLRVVVSAAYFQSAFISVSPVDAFEKPH